MPKQAVFDVAELSLDNTVSIFWNSPLLDYEFVCILNQYYALSLARQSDVDMFNGSRYPFFFYYDPDFHLIYVFVSLDLTRGRISPLSDPYNKVLLVNGRDASEKIDLLHRDILESCDDSPLSVIRTSLVDQQYFDFTHEEPHISILDQEKESKVENLQLSLFPSAEDKVREKAETRLRNMEGNLRGIYAAVEFHLNNLYAEDYGRFPLY